MGLDDSGFEGLHGLCMFFLPDEGGAFASEVDERLGDGGIIFDPYLHVAGDAQEGAGVGEIFARRPVSDSRNLGVIGDAAFVIALVAKEGDFWDCDGDLLGRNGGTSAEKTVEDVVDVVEVFPDKTPDLRISGNGLIPTILCFVLG